MDKTGPVFHPMISSIQKIALYETRGNFYLVGSNNTQTRFRVLKIDRSEPNDLLIYDDKTEYTVSEILDLINMIESGNRVRSVNGGFSKVISAFGIVGFIKFLEGYYIILITKRRKVALIGHHTIYKIEDTNMIYIPHETVRSIHPDEPRYVKMFQSIDLASNFYYSYSYDLTHTLQHNLTDPKQFMSNRNAEESHFDIPEDRNNLLTCSIVSTNNGRTESHKSEENYGIRITPNRKFVWNTHLLKDAESELHPDWLLYITHGFIGQSNITVFGRSLYLTLIARRSCRYAGTRFLKRGANFQGDVANEVETEQIVHDSCVSSLSRSHITSFVQMRGSIPGHWKQDMGKMVRKPAITIDLNDPYSETAAFHFNELLKRYGTPIIVLNLVKQRERKKQERLLSDELSSSIKYLNQFLPPEHQIIYKTFDMARKNKANVNVLRHLADIAKACVMKTGLFHNQKKYFAQKQSTVVGQDKSDNKNFSLQTGIIRTNCVDCLDRTNAAQFAIGKCVLGYQLCSLGIVDSPDLEFGTDCVRMLESLYEDHGDTLALQYGGSQLVHRVKTYRKTAPWTSQGNDIMQTLSRYYSNKFSDAEKQNTINLFLGLFVPEENKPQIWEFSTDYFFHHKPILCSNKSLTQWWDGNVMKCLPYAYNDMSKACYEIIQVHSKEIDMIDSYYDYHRPYELTILSDHYAFKISNSIRDFMPNFTTNYSPFALRVRPVKHREETSNKGHSMKNPSVTGQSSTSSTTSSASSSTDEGSCDEEDSVHTNESNTLTPSQDIHPSPVTFKSLFPSMKDVYGTEVTTPEPKDLLLYKKYVLIGKRASKAARKSSVTQFGSSSFQAESVFRDNFREVKPPSVPEKSLKIYENYVNLGKTAGNEPSEKDLEIYRKYARFSA